MKPDQIPTLPAKNFIFPVLRPLLTIIKCLKAAARIESDAPPVVLKRECLSNASFLSKALTELCRRAGINGGECEALLASLRDPSLWKSFPVDARAFNGLVKGLEAFCTKHKAALGGAYRQDKEFFDKLYRDSVLKRKVLIVHSSEDKTDVVKANLTSGCYYEVDTMPLEEMREKSLKHHVTIFLCTDTRKATDFLVRGSRMGVDIFLSDLGREIPVLNMSLCRLINQAQRSGQKFIPPPYVTLKLLPSVEEAYVRHLAEFDRAVASQESALAREEDALMAGMEETVLYAELVVESAWRKTAGFSMEQTVAAGAMREQESAPAKEKTLPEAGA